MHKYEVTYRNPMTRQDEQTEIEAFSGEEAAFRAGAELATEMAHNEIDFADDDIKFVSVVVLK
jgi:hypothetical protein